MNTDADLFAGCEPNTTGGTDDLGGGFDRSRWSGWKSRENWERVWRKRSRESIITIPTAGPGLGVNPLGTTFREETQSNPTIPPLPEEGGDDTAEPEHPSTELFEKGVGWKSRAGCVTCQTCENASSDRISWFAASQSVA